jgi:hypothetical protein
MLQGSCQEKLSAAKHNVLTYKINKLRDEIRVWWDKCLISEEEEKEEQNFEFCHSANFTPELYNWHKEKLEKLKRNFHRHE